MPESNNKDCDDVDLKRILTPITPTIDGYAVVIVQKKEDLGSPGAFLGCMVRAPGCDDCDRPMLLLSEAFREFNKKTGGAYS